MDIKGEARIEAARERVWEALNDTEILKASIPGCEDFERVSDHEFAAVVVSKVGPIKAKFNGRVTLSDIEAPVSYRLTGEGTGGAAGFAKAEIYVHLEAIEPEVTLLSYTTKATLGGKLAQLGSRMVDAAARRSADEFFELFQQQVAQVSAVEQESAATLDVEQLSDIVGGLGNKVEHESVKKAPATQPHRQMESKDKAPAGDFSAGKREVIESYVVAALTEQRIKVWISDGIALVTINQPDKRNAMSYGMWLAIPAVFASLERNPEVRVIILAGAGSDFCAGADISEFERIRDDAEQAYEYELAVDACCDAIAHSSKPTIAVVRGYCLGGGAHLAMSCDFRFADSAAIFGIPAARLSIIYGLRGTHKLFQLVGLSQAKKILYGAQRFDAMEALEIGFVDKVAGLETEEKPLKGFFSRSKAPSKSADPMVDAREWAKVMAQNAPLSIKGAKYQLNGLAFNTLDVEKVEHMIAEAAASKDYQEGRAAFKEKRQPVFEGH